MSNILKHPKKKTKMNITDVDVCGVRAQPQNRRMEVEQRLYTGWRCSTTYITEVLMKRKEIHLTS